MELLERNGRGQLFLKGFGDFDEVGRVSENCLYIKKKSSFSP